MRGPTLLLLLSLSCLLLQADCADSQCKWQWTCGDCIASGCAFGFDEQDVHSCVPAKEVDSLATWVVSSPDADCAVLDLYVTFRRSRESLTVDDFRSAVKSMTKILFQNFPTSTSQLLTRTAIKLLAHSSRWAHSSALSTLCDGVEDAKVKFLVDGQTAMLSDALFYLMNSKHALQERNTNKYRIDTSVVSELSSIDWTNLPQNAALLVDTLFLETLESQSQPGEFNALTTPRVRGHLNKRLRTGSLTLVVPLGWVGGLTVFNQLALLDVAEELATEFAQFVKRKKKSLEVFGRGRDIDRFLKNRVLTRLGRALGFSSKKTVRRRVVWLYSSLPPSSLYDNLDTDSALEALTTRVAQYMPPLRDFRSVMSKWLGSPSSRNDDQRAALRSLLEHSSLFSFNNLAHLCLQLQEQLRHAKLDKFYIPAPGKSFALVNLLYFMTTRGNAADFHPYYDGGSKHNYAILDDLSSTGQQLMSYAATGMRTPAILVASKLALLRHEDMLCVRRIEIPDDQKWSKSRGFFDQTALFSFPYMSPDNNGPLGAKVLASLFTPLAAVKHYGSPGWLQLASWSSPFEEQYNKLVDEVIERRVPSIPYPLVWL